MQCKFSGNTNKTSKYFSEHKAGTKKFKSIQYKQSIPWNVRLPAHRHKTVFTTKLTKDSAAADAGKVILGLVSDIHRRDKNRKCVISWITAS